MVTLVPGVLSEIFGTQRVAGSSPPRTLFFVFSINFYNLQPLVGQQQYPFGFCCGLIRPLDLCSRYLIEKETFLSRFILDFDDGTPQ
jgi:hypothetical protein